MSESLQNKRLLWLGHLERTEESFLPSKCRKFQGDSSVNREKPTNTWSKVIHNCKSQQGVFVHLYLCVLLFQGFPIAVAAIAAG